MLGIAEALKDRTFPAQIQDVFFDAMLEGYVGKPNKSWNPGLPGSKVIEYRRESWLVVDSYIVSEKSPYSGGTTYIYYDGVPVWMMQYFGFYDGCAIPTLKAALREAYEERIFFGGRGPRTFLQDVHTYRNSTRSNDFKSFSGREEIENVDAEFCGFHQYQGGLLF